MREGAATAGGATPDLSLGPRVAIQALVLGVLLVGVFWGPLCYVTARWASDANWSHGWLVPLFSLYFLYTRRHLIARAPRRTSYSGLALFVTSLAAYFVFLAVKPYIYFQLLALVGVILSITLFMTGWRMLRVVWLPILFLCFANPIPDRYYVAMTMPLRLVTTQVARLLLSVIPGIELEVQGVLIDYHLNGDRGTLNVEEACAGMRLMMALLTLGVAMAYMGDRPIWQRVCMVAACVPVAMFCNILRVTATGYLTVYNQEELAQGTAHELLGLAMLPLALGLFALIGVVLRHLIIEEEDGGGGQGESA